MRVMAAAGINSLAELTTQQLTTILNYHILPPVPYIDATWTTPFFAALSGPVATALPGASIAIEPTGYAV